MAYLGRLVTPAIAGELKRSGRLVDISWPRDRRVRAKRSRELGNGCRNSGHGVSSLLRACVLGTKGPGPGPRWMFSQGELGRGDLALCAGANQTMADVRSDGREGRCIGKELYQLQNRKSALIRDMYM